MGILTTTVLPLILISGALLVGFAVRRRKIRSIMESSSIVDWELLARGQEACAAAGHPDHPVRVISGNGSPVLQLESGTLYLSPAIGDLLTDDELKAIVIKMLGAPTRITWQDYVAVYGGPLGLFVLLLIPSLVTGVAYWWLALVVGIPWTTVVNQRGLLGARKSQESLRRFLAAGGDPAAYARTQMKIIRLLMAGARPDLQRGLADALRVELNRVVAASGLSWEQINEMAAQMGVQPQVYGSQLTWRERMARHKGLIKLGLYALLLLLSVLVAISLGR